MLHRIQSARIAVMALTFTLAVTITGQPLLAQRIGPGPGGGQMPSRGPGPGPGRGAIGQGGGARPQMPSRPQAANRPQMPSRPQATGRPYTANRPSMPTGTGDPRVRPSLGQNNLGGAAPGVRPSTMPGRGPGMTRPDITRPGGGDRPDVGRPGSSRPTITRPDGTVRPERPTSVRPERPTSVRPERPAPVRPNPLDRPGAGSRPDASTRPFPGPGSFPGTRPEVGGRPLPGTRPEGIGRPERPGRPEIPGRPERPDGPSRPLPGTRPDRPVRPNPDGDRPGAGSRPGERPSIGIRPEYPSGTLPSRPNRPSYPNRPVPPIYPERPHRPGHERPGFERPGFERPGHERPGYEHDHGHRPPNRPGRPNRPGSSIIVGGGNSNIHSPNVNLWLGNGWGGGHSSWGYPHGSNWHGSNWHGSHWHHPPHHHHHHSWYHGYWNSGWSNAWHRPSTSLYVGWGLGAFSPSFPVYQNPYYVSSSTMVYNYAQPIVVEVPVAVAGSDPLDSGYSVGRAAAAPATEPTNAALVTAGLDAFRDGDYAKAIKYWDDAIRENSGDPVLHELLALALFAAGDYQPAAAILNALLATTPGMDWTTLSGLYGDIEQYTQQLRRLENHIEQNRDDAAAMFVLAYHYLVTGAKDEAVDLLTEVVKLQPGDQVAADMLKALTTPQLNAPAPASSAAPTVGNPPESLPAPAANAEPDTSAPTTAIGDSEAGQPVPDVEVDWIGSWKADDPRVTVELSVDDQFQFSWLAKPITDDQTQTPVSDPVPMTGELLVDGDFLILETPQHGAMVGRITEWDADQFRFSIAPGDNSDPGLLFKRQTP